MYLLETVWFDDDKWWFIIITACDIYIVCHVKDTYNHGLGLSLSALILLYFCSVSSMGTPLTGYLAVTIIVTVHLWEWIVKNNDQGMWDFQQNSRYVCLP